MRIPGGSLLNEQEMGRFTLAQEEPFFDWLKKNQTQSNDASLMQELKNKAEVVFPCLVLWTIASEDASSSCADAFRP
jgi:hypothetical protein